MRKAKSFPLLAAVAAATALAATVSAAPASAQSSRASALSCTSTLNIGMLAPLTGGAGFLGQEQLSWAKLAVKTLPQTMGLKIRLVPGDAPAEQGPSAAQTVAAKFVANKNIVAVLGGSTSGSVAATSKTFDQAGIVQVSPSATRTTLTKGDNQEATKSFYRVVPADDYQGPTDANYMINTLHAKNVVLFDFQEPYSQGLSGEAGKALKAAGVTVSTQSVPNTVTDFSSYVTKVPSDADVVFFPTQQPPAAQTFAEQLVEQGKKATMFSGDGSDAPAQYKKPGGYVSVFAPDISGIPADKDILAGWKKANPGKALDAFGPPTYGAVDVLLTAIKNVCAKNGGTVSRANLISAVKHVVITNWILGGTFKFSTKTNDPLNAKFYIFKIQSDGSYKLVG
jgi:branched-chain amino acid transport system substrate-binding protein